MNDFVKKVYFAYFKLKLRDQDKPWTLRKIYRRFEKDVIMWFKCKKKTHFVLVFL